MHPTTITLQKSEKGVFSFRGHRKQLINVAGSKYFDTLEAATSAALSVGLVVGDDCTTVFSARK